MPAYHTYTNKDNMIETITCTTPPLPEKATKKVLLRIRAISTNAASQSFTFTYFMPPIVNTCSPSSGDIRGGTLVAMKSTELT